MAAVVLNPPPAPPASPWQVACLNEAPPIHWPIWAEGSIEYRVLADQQREYDLRLGAYWNQLYLAVVRIPLRTAPLADIAHWQQRTRASVNRMGPWNRLDDRLVARYVVHLEEAIFKAADSLPQTAQQAPVRPHGYRLWLRHNPREMMVQNEVTDSIRHSYADATNTLRNCRSPQQMIDELARNRIWPLPWFGDYTHITRPMVQQHLMLRARWIVRTHFSRDMDTVLTSFQGTYLDLLVAKKKVFFEEAYGFVLQEATELLAWHFHEGFPDPLPRRRHSSGSIDWRYVERNVRNNSPLGLINRDHYSSLYIEAIVKPCNLYKPKSLGIPVDRVQAWMAALMDNVNPTFQSHFSQSSVFTLEMAWPMVPILQYAYDYLVISDRAEWPFNNAWIPRALFQQLQVRVDGNFEGKRAPLLTREMLITGRLPMVEGEIKHQYMRHLKAQRDQAVQPSDDEEVSDVYMTDSSGRSNPIRSRPTKRREGTIPRHKLRRKFWQIPTYNLKHFPSLETVKYHGEVRISDAARLPADFILSWGWVVCFYCLKHSPRVGVDR
ncbi:hypothetical protein CALVIDRAFT_532082, partial [Calocera viscosa TUFC12733]